MPCQIGRAFLFQIVLAAYYYVSNKQCTFEYWIIIRMKDNNKPYYILFLILALVVNFVGINVNFFTDDPALYAYISKNLLLKKDFFELFTYNQDWLDKPHFPFWMVLCSFKIFGISAWAYRLPALIFFVISLFYTYLFGKKYYTTEIAWVAVLILATSQHVVMMNTDVRAEPYLMALVMGSIYHISCLAERFSFGNLLLAALLTACAIMTKGVFVIVAIYGALFGQLLFQKKYREMFRLKWVGLVLLTIVFTLPEIYALYIQFDIHPEKTVFNQQHVSGIKWFLWDSQFGRFVNSGPITKGNSGSIFFFIHTLIWAFAPWCLLFYYAIYNNVKAIWAKTQLPEYYAFSGGLLLLLLFSLSRFQLPFYTNTIFPLFAIVTAPFCVKQLNRFGTFFRIINLWIYTIVFVAAILAIHYLSKPDHSLLFIIDCIAFGLIIVLIWAKVKTSHSKAFFFVCATMLFVNFYLNTTFYKLVASYNGQIKAASYINQNTSNAYHLYTLRLENNSFQFYTNKPIAYIPLDQFEHFDAPANSVFYATHTSVAYLRQTHAHFKVVKAFENYPQENILPAFVNKTTRNKVLDSVYLIKK